MCKTYLSLVLVFLFGVNSLNAQTEKQKDGFVQFFYEDGTVSSEGHFANGVPVGVWKNYYPNGAIKSEGKRINGQLDSTWIFYNEEGLFIESVSFTNGKKNGTQKLYNEEGLLTTKSGFADGVKIGYELKYYPEEQLVQSEKPYVEGRLEGIGYGYNKESRVINVYYFEKGVLKETEAVNRTDNKGQPTSKWIEFYPKRDTLGRYIIHLEGRYQKGLKEGYWREYDKRGKLIQTLKYVNGQLVMNPEELANVDVERSFYENAQVHWERTYVNGQPHGIWKEYDADGNLISGKYYVKGVLVGKGITDAQGLRQGPWIEYYPTGEVRAEGEYLNGDRYKKWKFYFISGKLEQVGAYLEGGLYTGLWTWYYENDQVLREEYYRKGREDGEVMEYNDSGRIVVQGFYYEGYRDGDWVIEDSDYQMRGAYVEGYRDGEWTHYYLDTDELSFKGSYVEGEPIGKHTYYYDNGRKMLEGKYEGGLKSGEWRRYSKEGLVLLTVYYENGEYKKLDGKKLKLD